MAKRSVRHGDTSGGTAHPALGVASEGLTREEAEKRRTSARRRAAWDALRWLWEASGRERTRKCRRLPTAQLVGIQKRLSRAHYSGLQTCGWDGCPCCGPRIAADRAADIAAAISSHYASGGSVALVTLTLRHSVGQRLGTLLGAATSAWAAIRKDRTVRARLDALTVGYIKSNDLTVGRNGWHPHPHVLLFVKPGTPAPDVFDLGHAMFKAWSRRLVRLGFAAPTEKHGVDVKVLDLSSAHEAVAEYVTASEYVASRPPQLVAALEVANGNGKMARRGNRTPMQLLADCVTGGKPADRRLWAEYEVATQKRHRLRWSDGLRARLIPELGPALTDEEAAASDDGKGRLIARIDAETWRKVRERRHGPEQLLEWAEVHDDDDQARALLSTLLRAHDLGDLFDPHALPEPEPEPEPAAPARERILGPAAVPASIRAYLDKTGPP